VAFVLYIQRFFEPIRDLGFRWNNLQMAMAAGEHIIEILDTEIQMHEDPHPVPLVHMRGEVEFCHVSFHYHPATPVLPGFLLARARWPEPGHCGPYWCRKDDTGQLVARFYDVTAARS